MKPLPAPTTVGEHVKRVRSERRLRQVDVSATLGVTPQTVLHWEAGHTEPLVAVMPAVVQFLGYEPWPEPQTLGERMKVYRLRRGLSIKAAAARLGVDEGSWGTWEKTGATCSHQKRALLEDFLAHDRTTA